MRKLHNYNYATQGLLSVTYNSFLLKGKKIIETNLGVSAIQLWRWASQAGAILNRVEKKSDKCIKFVVQKK